MSEVGAEVGGGGFGQAEGQRDAAFAPGAFQPPTEAAKHQRPGTCAALRLHQTLDFQQQAAQVGAPQHLGCERHRRLAGHFHLALHEQAKGDGGSGKCRHARGMKNER